MTSCECGPSRTALPRRLLSSGGFLSAFLVCARAVEDAHHGVVALVARILVDVIVAARHRQRNRERFREYGGIVNRVLIIDQVGVHSREAFDRVRVCRTAIP